MTWLNKYFSLKKSIAIFGLISLEIGHHFNNLYIILMGFIASIIAIAMLFKK